MRLTYPWLVVMTLGFTETVSWGILYYAFGVFIVPMEAELGWSRTDLSGAFSLAVVVLAIAGLPVGQWLDRRGPRLLMTAGSLLGVVLLLAWSGVRDLGSFYAIWALMGVCWAGTLYSPAFATVTALFRERRTEALTVVTLMAGLASTIFLPLAAVLVDLLGWREALLVLAATLGAATVLPHALVLRSPPPHDAAAEPSLSLGEALRHRSFRWLAIGFSCFAVGIGVNVHLVPYLMEHGYDGRVAAATAGLVGLMQLAGRVLLVAVERRLALAAVVAGAYVLQPIAIVLLIAGAPLAFVALFGAGRGADTILRNTLVSRLYGARRFASIAAVLSLFVGLVSAVGPLAQGALRDALGAYEAGFGLVAAVSVVTIFALWRGTAEAGG